MKRWWIPILGVIVITPFTPYLDMAIERSFYSLGEGNVDHFVSNRFTSFMYTWGVVPAQIIFIVSLFGYLTTFVIRKLKGVRNYFLLPVLTLAIGSGFIVNWVLKDHWGRPRPKQLEAFGGSQQYRAFYNPNFYTSVDENFKSFPCGHCTMGFFFLTFVPMGWRLQSRGLVLFGWFVGIGWGVAMGVTRMAQGGHFFSDVLIAGVIMWFTALAMDLLLFDEAA